MDTAIFSVEPSGQGWVQIGGLVLAFALSSLIGLEREVKYKSAGLRTHTLVGLGSALLMLVSKYGFFDVLGLAHVGLDPSRVAAQIVSGIGFIGGGLIFVRRDIVHGLTTAATVWLTAAIGMACGGGLHILALIACTGYFVVVFGYTTIMNRVRGSVNRLRICYRAGHDVIAAALALCSAKNFAMIDFSLDAPHEEVFTVEMRIRGRGSAERLAQDLVGLAGVDSVNVNPPED